MDGGAGVVEVTPLSVAAAVVVVVPLADRLALLFVERRAPQTPPPFGLSPRPLWASLVLVLLLLLLLLLLLPLLLLLLLLRLLLGRFSPPPLPPPSLVTSHTHTPSSCTALKKDRPASGSTHSSVSRHRRHT